KIGRDPVRDLLSIATIHPIRLDYAHQILSKSIHDPDELIERLVNSGEMKLVKYRWRTFLVRRRREICED
ncbi:MAG: hypothetical protein DRN47_05345, partial [Candidatus Wolframiiraptor sp.]